MWLWGALNSTPNIVLSLDVKKFSFEIDLWWFGYTLTRFSNVVLVLLFDIWVEFGLSQLAPILSAVSFHKFILFASDVPWVRPMHSFVSHVLQGDVMLRPLKALAALKQLDTGRAMQLLQQVADSWLWWRSRLSWLQIPFWKAGFNAAAKTRLEAQVRFWDCTC